MNDSFFIYAGFEMQYKNIKPQILIEKLLRNKNSVPVEYEIYCFNGEPEFFQSTEHTFPCAEVSVYDKDFSDKDISFCPEYLVKNKPAGENLKKAVSLSKFLCRGFKLVRVDRMEFENNICFSEMTFTPFSGFFRFKDIEADMELGRNLNLGRGD